MGLMTLNPRDGGGKLKVTVSLKNLNFFYFNLSNRPITPRTNLIPLYALFLIDSQNIPKARKSKNQINKIGLLEVLNEY